MQTPFLEHSHYLNIVKRILKADFVGWVEEKDKKSLKVKIKGKEFILPFEGEITHETYSDLIKNLLNKEENEKGRELQETV